MKNFKSVFWGLSVLAAPAFAGSTIEITLKPIKATASTIDVLLRSILDLPLITTESFEGADEQRLSEDLMAIVMGDFDNQTAKLMVETKPEITDEERVLVAEKVLEVLEARQ